MRLLIWTTLCIELRDDHANLGVFCEKGAREERLQYPHSHMQLACELASISQADGGYSV
ncbi:MAG: hypothetical protein KDB27_31530 [Planctomycetales bacterium]|nr:hypothetical protein [Planctomycetales bacterium]